MGATTLHPGWFKSITDHQSKFYHINDMNYIIFIALTILTIIVSGNERVQRIVDPKIAAVITWSIALLLHSKEGNL